MEPSARSVSATAARLHSFAIHLLRHVRTVDVESGLSAARLSALSVLVFGGERTLGDLAEAEQVSAPTVTRLVSALERDGLVRRSRDPADGRVTRVAASARGRRVLEAGRDRRVARVAELLSGLDADQRRDVDAALDALEGALAAE